MEIVFLPFSQFVSFFHNGSNLVCIHKKTKFLTMSKNNKIGQIAFGCRSVESISSHIWQVLKSSWCKFKKLLGIFCLFQKYLQEKLLNRFYKNEECKEHFKGI